MTKSKLLLAGLLALVLAPVAAWAADAPEAPDAPRGRSAGMVIFAPSFSRSEPSITTRSPTCRPDAMLVRSPSTGPTFT